MSTGDENKRKSFYKDSSLIGGIGLVVGVGLFGLLWFARKNLDQEYLLLLFGAGSLAVVAGVAYAAWLMLRTGVRELSKDVTAGKEEAKLEADILRAQLAEKEVEVLRAKLAEAERLLGEADSDGEE